MAHKIQIKRGNKADIPILNDGEMGLCIDTQEVFIGCNGTNIPVNSLASFEGALVYLTASQSIANETHTIISFGAKIYDTKNFFNSSNPTRLTVPDNVNKVILKAQVHWGTSEVGNRSIRILKNGETFAGMPHVRGRSSSETGIEGNRLTHQNMQSAVVNVIEGDYFELSVYHNAGAAINVGGGFPERTWFALEVIE